ncbi:MAG: polyphosphate kinase 2 family protein [Acidimicrobiia bacterium]|nr:polyphosphate kinase 2 family protein [Acidimicrobiia bacterium]NNC76033.1 polyphosphate kinase 2 family protein [Acidimicrobiia bacterium]
MKVEPGSRVDLSAISATETGGLTREDAERRFKDLAKELGELGRLLWADGSRKLLMVLQAMDTGGKDGTIRKVFRRTNPQGVKIANFKVPTTEELAHDYLWRVHEHTPGSGEIGVFNRSHYEDVLVVRVLDLVPEERWSKRFDHINAFEKLLADEGTIIRKFYLHIDKDEQKRRLQARLDDPTKNWKFNTGDLDHRKLWDSYMAAYEDVLERTSTDHAPWHIIPANHKWYRNLLVAEVLVEALRGAGLEYPLPEEDLDGIVIE